MYTHTGTDFNPFIVLVEPIPYQNLGVDPAYESQDAGVDFDSGPICKCISLCQLLAYLNDGTFAFRKFDRDQLVSPLLCIGKHGCYDWKLD
jgi:hypothetical protein